MGLKADGTLVTRGMTTHGQCNVGKWTDIVAIDASAFYTVGLKADGTVVLAGDSDDGKSKVREWTNIIAISASDNHIVGLKADGTVVSTGTGNKSNVQNWSNIATKAPNVVPPSNPPGNNDNNPTESGIGSDFKAAMDSYEDFMDEYVAFMKKYEKNPNDLSLIADYANFMSKYSKAVKDFEKWEDEDLNDAEMAYYIDVQTRVNKKLLEAAQ